MSHLRFQWSTLFLFYYRFDTNVLMKQVGKYGKGDWTVPNLMRLQHSLISITLLAWTASENIT